MPARCEIPDPSDSVSEQPLGHRPKGWKGQVVTLIPIPGGGIPWNELERRLLEMGFVEGASLEILHEGPVRHDPIAVRVDDCTIAIRRCDADAILCREERV